MLTEARSLPPPRRARCAPSTSVFAVAAAPQIAIIAVTRKLAGSSARR